MEGLVKVQYFEQYSAQQHNSYYLLPFQQLPSPLVKIQHEDAPQSNKLLLEKRPQIRRDILSVSFQRLLNKYFISISEEEFESLVQRAVKLKATLPNNNKIESEFVPAVFYYFYVDQIGIYNPKDFCKRNGLNTRKFNRKYINCVSYFRKENPTCLQGESSQAKSSDRQEEDLNKDLLENSFTVSSGLVNKKAQKIDENLSTLEAIDLVYDFVFKNEYFQNNRRQIILKLVEKYEQTNPRLIQAIDWTDKPILKIYYIMIFYFRLYRAPFTFTEVKEAVYQKLNLRLTKDGYYAIIRLFKKFEKNGELQDKTTLRENQEVNGQ